MNARRFLSTIVLVLAFAGCGGGGGGGSAVPAPHPTSSSGNGSTQRVAISLVVPQNGGTTGIKHRAYISASALGAGIVVTQGSTTVNATLDLSSSSGACTGSGSTRTCTTTVTVPLGTDTFAITIYNESPVNGAIPSGAQILGVGSSTVPVVAGTTSSVSVYIGGEIASFGSTLPSGSLPANGQAQTAVLVIAPTDFGDNPIAAGKNDPYANPITVSIAETGGSGHASLSLNGGANASSVIVTQSSDSVALHYDGGGSPGYSFTISLSASGVSTQTSKIAPLIASLAGSGVTSLSLNGTVTNETLTVGIAGASATYTATPAACTNIATFGAVSGSGASATLSVAGGSAASGSGCTLTVAANGTSLVLPVVNTPVGATVTINGTAITEYTGFENPYGITKGPDGNIWFTDQGNDDVYAFNPSTTALQYTYSTGQSLYGIATGSDGALWCADQSNGGVLRITTSGIQDSYPFTGTPQGIAPGPNGLMLIADNTSGGVWTLDAGGQFTILPFSPSGTPAQVTWVPGGSLGDAWFTEGTYIGDFSLNNNTLTTEIPTPNGGLSNSIAYGPDGNLWVTIDGGTNPGIAIVNPSTDAVTNVPIAGSDTNGIVAGVDGAMWVADQANNSVDEITVSGHTVTKYPLPTSNATPRQIALGADGSLWVTENNVGQLAHIVP